MYNDIFHAFLESIIFKNFKMENYNTKFFKILNTKFKILNYSKTKLSFRL